MKTLDLPAAEEKIMIQSLLAWIREFYKNPENEKAYEEWKKNKEANKNDSTNYNNYTLNRGKS